jgi:hypothetical protein
LPVDGQRGATISPFGWLVFVEVRLEEVFAPLYGAAWRTGLMLVLGLLATALAVCRSCNISVSFQNMILL